MMSFDLQGSWQSTLEHHSPLYPRGAQVGDERYKNVVSFVCELFHSCDLVLDMKNINGIC